MNDNLKPVGGRAAVIAVAEIGLGDVAECIRTTLGSGELVTHTGDINGLLQCLEHEFPSIRRQLGLDHDAAVFIVPIRDFTPRELVHRKIPVGVLPGAPVLRHDPFNDMRRAAVAEVQQVVLVRRVRDSSHGPYLRVADGPF